MNGAMIRWERARASASLLVMTLSLMPLLVAPRVRAQLPEDSSGVSLQSALDAALEHATQLQIGVRQVRIAEGGLLTAGAPFDPRIVASVGTARSNDVSSSPSGELTSALTRNVTSSIDLSTRFRSGIVVTPSVGIAHVDVSGVPGSLGSRASVELGVVLPLLRDRGGKVSAAPERAARRIVEASVLDARHTAAATVLAVAVAYWNDLAAEEQIDVYRSSELRASRLVDDTRRLVDADERPAADLEQLLANLALKRAARLTGEQAAVEARQTLMLAMGVYDDTAITLPRAITGFPDVAPDGSSGDGSSGEGVLTDDLHGALDRRADLAALRARSIAAGVQLEAARDGLRSRLDLSIGLGYKGLGFDRGFGGAISSLYRNVPGLDGSMQLSYELPLASMAARGEMLRSRASYDQARIREAELVRQISSGVRVAREALRHGRDALRASREAVVLSRKAVENEKKKFQLGMSTLFDVILAEDALTNARLGEIAGAHAYAIAIARLRYEMGIILDTDSEAAKASAQVLEREP